MHLCYAVACDDDTTYAQLAYISARAARIVHPDITISILVDAKSLQQLNVQQCKILAVADHVVTVACDYESVVDRSRFIKTSCRSHVQGDFVLIDADAIPVRSLQTIFDFDCDLSLALDNDNPHTFQTIPDWVAEIYEKMGWTWAKPNYFNTGVILFRDTPKTHALSELWHERWQQTRANGCDKDQPSFNSAVAVVNPDIHILPVRYNAMIYHRTSKIRNAAVVHFLISGDAQGHSILPQLLAGLKETGDVNEAQLKQFIQSRYAWTEPHYVAARWYLGQYCRFAQAVAVKICRKLTGK